MNKNLKIAIIAIIAALIVGGGTYFARNNANNKKVIYTNQFVVEQIGNELLKDTEYKIENLQEQNEDVHNSKMTTDKIAKANSAEFFLTLEKSNSPSQNTEIKNIKNVVDLSKNITYKEAAWELEEEHNHEGESEEEHANHAHSEYDPHIFVSPIMLLELEKEIKTELSAKLPALNSKLETNSKNTRDKLNEYSAKYAERLTNKAAKTVIIEHNGLTYLQDDYRFVVMAFKSNEDAEPTADQVIKINETIEREKITNVLAENQDASYIKNLVDKGLTFQEVNYLEGPTGKTLYAVLDSNLNAIEKAIK